MCSFRIYILLITTFRFVEAKFILLTSEAYANKEMEFMLTCNIGSDETATAITWSRNDSSVAYIRISDCFEGDTGHGLYSLYKYNCTKSTRLYNLIIPTSRINSEKNSMWKCGSSGGGANSNEYTLQVIDTQYSLLTSEPYVSGEKDFILSCKIALTEATTVITWSRNGVSVVYIRASDCAEIDTGQGLYNLYKYNCTSSTRRYNLIIPTSRINSDGDTQWKCGPSGGGADSNIYTLQFYAAPSGDPVITGYNGSPRLSGNIIFLTCTAKRGIPLATLNWTCNGASIPGISLGTLTLTITMDASYNGQSCTCTASHPRWTTDKDVQSKKFVVHYSPIIYLNNSPVAVHEGQEIKRTCSAIGYPVPTVNWFKNNEPFTSDIVNSSTLILKKVSKNDTGIYTCKAEAKYTDGNQSQIFRSQKSLQIYVYYMSINKPEPVCLSSDSISISCCSVMNASKPLRFFGWKHSIGHTTIRTLKGKMISPKNISLSLDYCGYYDSGTYTCLSAVDLHENNTWQEVHSALSITVPAPPVVSLSYVIDNVKSTRKTMAVKFYSVPKPEIVEWIKDGGKVTYSNKYQQITSVINVTMLFYTTSVVVEGYQSSLSIQNAIDSDFGAYSFIVKNAVGSAQTQLILDQAIDNGNGTGNMTGILFGGVIGSIALVSTVAVVIVCFVKRRRNQQGFVQGNRPESNVRHSVGTSTCDNGEDRSYQDIDIQMYEVLKDTDGINNKYETLPEQL